MIIVDNNKSVSLGLWIPLIWYFISATRGISYWIGANLIDSGNIDYLEGSPLDRNIYITLIVIGLFILIKRRLRWSLIFQKNVWIIVLLLYMLLSILWSDFPEVASKRWIKTTGTFVMALLVLTENNPFQAILILLRRCFIVHLPLDLITIKYFRNIGVAWSKDGQYAMWTGLTTHKNILGQICMTSGLYFIWDLVQKIQLKRIIIDIFYLTLIIYLMNGPGYSKSTTSMVVLLIGLVVLFGLQYSKSIDINMSKMIIKLSVALIIFVLFLYLGLTALEKNKSIPTVALETVGRDTTFTGRTELWTDIISIASKNPIFGVGYGSFWIGDRANNIWEKHTWKPGQGHNGYIDVYVELGLVGILLLLALLYFTFKNIRETIIEDFEYGRFRMALFVMIFVHNITESSFVRSNHNIWFLFLIIAINIPAMALKHGNTPLKTAESIA